MGLGLGGARPAGDLFPRARGPWASRPGHVKVPMGAHGLWEEAAARRPPFPGTEVPMGLGLGGARPPGASDEFPPRARVPMGLGAGRRPDGSRPGHVVPMGPEPETNRVRGTDHGVAASNVHEHVP